MGSFTSMIESRTLTPAEEAAQGLRFVRAGVEPGDEDEGEAHRPAPLLSRRRMAAASARRRRCGRGHELGALSGSAEVSDRIRR